MLFLINVNVLDICAEIVQIDTDDEDDANLLIFLLQLSNYDIIILAAISYLTYRMLKEYCTFLFIGNTFLQRNLIFFIISHLRNFCQDCWSLNLPILAIIWQLTFLLWSMTFWMSRFTNNITSTGLGLGCFSLVPPQNLYLICFLKDPFSCLFLYSLSFFC